MANAVYPAAKQSLLKGDLDLDGTVKVVGVTSGYTYSTAHDNLDDVTGGLRVATGTLANKTFASGVFDADNVTFTAVSGSAIAALILYLDTGTESTSKLIAYIDSASAGLPVTPNGGDITLTWNASGIFAL